MLKQEVAVMISLNLSISCQWSHACQLLQDPYLLIMTICFPRALRKIMLSCFLKRLLGTMPNKRVEPWLLLVPLQGLVHPENRFLWISRSLQVFPMFILLENTYPLIPLMGAIFCCLWIPWVSWALCSCQPSIWSWWSFSRGFVFDPGSFTRFLKSLSVAWLVLFNWINGEQSVMYYLCHASNMRSDGCSFLVGFLSDKRGVTTSTQVWVLMNHVYQVVLSSLLTNFVLKVLWSLDQWLVCTFPMDLVCIHAYLGCIQVCSGFPSSTSMLQSYGI